MDSVTRALAVYVVLLIVLRLSGKRTLSEMTTFNFVLLLMVSEATQQALLGEDFSVTNAALVILTLVALDRGADFIRFRWDRADRLSEGVPLLLVENGRPVDVALRKEHIGLDEILAAARESQGLERLDQIRYAVLENSGGISIVPREPDSTSA
jgi:uncharacterized membrane protein YcaP (DUF421 family)